MTRFAASLVSAAIATAAVPTAPAFPSPKLQTAQDFVVEQVAGTEQVVFPMFAAFDELGRLFVAESSGHDLYAEITAGTRMCRVKLLEDKDGDGRFEASRVFADRLVFPMGLVWRKGTRQTADSVVLRSASGADVQLRRNQIQEMSRVAASIMPEGLEQEMTSEEFRDLLVPGETARRQGRRRAFRGLTRVRRPVGLPNGPGLAQGDASDG